MVVTFQSFTVSRHRKPLQFCAGPPTARFQSDRFVPLPYALDLPSHAAVKSRRSAAARLMVDGPFSPSKYKGPQLARRRHAELVNLVAVAEEILGGIRARPWGDYWLRPRGRRVATASGVPTTSWPPCVLPSMHRSSRVRPCRSDLRRAHGLRHPMEDGHALAAAAGRDRLAGVSVATVDVLPVVHHPHVPGRSDREIGLHLEAAAHVPAGRRDLVAGLEAGRAVLGAHAAEVRDRRSEERRVGKEGRWTRARC